MRLLFAISIACFCAVLWVLLSLARRVRSNRATTGRKMKSVAAQEFFEAGEFRTPRPLTLTQDLSFHRQRTPLLHPEVAIPIHNFNPQSRPAFNPRVEPTVSARPALSYGSSATSRPDSRPQQPMSRLQPAPVGDFAQHRDQSSVTPIDSQSAALAGRRKSPQSVSRSGLRRIDLSQYDNEDSGDLTDPYTHPLRGSGTQGGPIGSI